MDFHACEDSHGRIQSSLNERESTFHYITDEAHREACEVSHGRVQFVLIARFIQISYHKVEVIVHCKLCFAIINCIEINLFSLPFCRRQLPQLENRTAALNNRRKSDQAS